MPQKPTPVPSGFVPDGFEPDAPVNVGDSASFSVNGKPVADQVGDAFKNFAVRFAEDVNPKPILDAIFAEAQRKPTGALDAIGKATLGPAYGPLRADYAARNERLRAAREDYAKGNHVAAANNLIGWLLPLAGPMIAQFGDAVQAGQLDKASADVAAGLLMPKAMQGAPDAVRAAASGASKLADRMSQARMVDVMAPVVGPNKQRFGNMAVRVAGDLARDPDVASMSRAGLQQAVEGKLDAIGQDMSALDTTIPRTRMHGTTPVAKGIQAKIDALTRSGIGGTVEPANHASRIAALRQALTEVQGLGNLANFQNLNKLRGDWDLGGRAKYTQAVGPDYMKMQGTASGWADAAGVLREYLAQKQPDFAELNAKYSVYKNAADVMRAAEESQRVRPRVGRAIFAGAAGSMAGSAAGGPMGAAMGAVLAPIMDAMVIQGPTTKIATARALARVADALRSGSPASRVRYELFNAARSAGALTPELSTTIQQATAAGPAFASDQQSGTR